MRFSPLVLLLPLAAAPALAQTAALAPGDYSHGLTLPPTGAALADEATAPEVNPAGLTYLGDSQLAYLHERNVGKSLLGDGLFLSDTFFDFVGASVSVQWLRGTQIPAYRKTTYALSLGVQELSFGAAFNFFSAHGSDLDGLSSIDLGLMSRPARFLSIAAVIKNVDALSQGSVAFERRYDLGIGLRPIGERYTLGVDYLWGDNAGPSGGRMSYALQAEVLNGVCLGAGLSHGFNNSGDVLFQLSATINTAHVGATYALGDSPGIPGDSFSGLDHVVEVRVSREKYRPLSVNDGKIALFDLAELLSGTGTPGQTFLGITAEDPYLRTTRMLDQASRDPRLHAVVLKLDTLPGGLGHMDELRDAVIRLRASGKRVIAVLLNAGDSEYLVASAADKIYAVPQAMLDINGFVANVEFLGGTMDWLGVDWDVARVGAFKNAPDQLTRTRMSAEQKEAIDAYLDAFVRNVSKRVTESRKLTAEQWQAAIDTGLKSPRVALEQKLIDE
ncbi:MAG TPA: S49 family peptidase, partial [Myxococcaceae bacterium]|nr:S49 family peptidase [Myxococcaceae bacterium]